MTGTESPHLRPEEQLVLELFVRDLKASLAFYTRLGFAIERSDDSFAVLRFEGCELLLDQRPWVSEPPARPQANIRVMVKDADAAWALASDMKACVFAPIADRSYGLRDFTILDPDGFGVRFASYIQPRAPA